MARIGRTYPKQQSGHAKRRLPLIPTQQTKKPIWTNWTTRKANTDGLQASAIVYACIRKLSTASASVPWRVEQKNGDRWEPAPDHPLELLIEKPNPYMTRQDLIERLTQHLNLGGNGIWHLNIARGTSTPKEIWPLQPDDTKPIPSTRNYIQHYEYTIDSLKKIIIPNKEIIHFQFPNPTNPYWGLSPLQAVARVVDTDVEAVNWNKISLQNRAVPDGVFQINAPDATNQMWEEAREQVRQRYLEKGHEPWVLFNVEYKQMSLTPVEMDFLNSRRFNREEIASVFGVLPILIGAMDGTTYNNIHTAKRIFWEDTVIPYLDDIRKALNTTLLPYYDPAANRNDQPNNLRFTYDLSNISALQDNYGKKVRNARILFDLGIPTTEINDRLELGFNPDNIPETAIRNPQSTTAINDFPPDDDTRDPEDPKNHIRRIITKHLQELIPPPTHDTQTTITNILNTQPQLEATLRATHKALAQQLGTTPHLEKCAQHAKHLTHALALKLSTLTPQEQTDYHKYQLPETLKQFTNMQLKPYKGGT